MGGEFLTQTPTTYTEQFEKVCSWYMSIGMSYDEFWEGDSVLPKYYREAHEYKNTQTNQELWLLGVYIHEAIGVVVHNATKKRGAKALKFTEKPYPITKLEKQYEKEQQEKRERQNREKAKAIFEAWANNFKPKKGDSK